MNTTSLRRTFALVLSAAMIVSLSIVPAMAAGSGTARLSTGVNVLPGDGQPFAIRVDTQVFAVNAVRIDLPFGQNGITTADGVEAPAGWEVSRVDSSGAQFLLYHGGPIAPFSSQTFEFPGDVPAPANRDLPGTFRVSLSSDGGQTFSRADVTPNGTLTSTVRILEVTGLAVTAPPLATDGTGTAGQEIVVQSTVKNHATDSVTVTPSLNSRKDQDSVGSPEPADAGIGGNGGTASFNFPVTLGPADEDRTSTFTAGATAPNANAIGKVIDYEVQVAPMLEDPRNLEPTLVRSGQMVEFSLLFDKSGNPALSLESGSLSFADTTASVQPRDFPEGSADDETVVFTGTVEGSDGTYDVDIALQGTDGNGATFEQTFSLSDAIEIDNLAPIIEIEVNLPRDGDGGQQTAAKTGDRISVRGTIDDRGAPFDFVELRPDVGDPIPVPVSRTPDPAGGDRFSGDVEADFALAATNFRAVAQAADGAGNVGGDASELVDIDNLIPILVSPGRTLLDSEIPGAGSGGSVPAVIEVRFDDFGNPVKGGCNETAWRVDGSQVVRDITYGDGSTCVPGEAGDDNVRLLWLTVPIDRDDTPSVTYTPIQGDRAKDSAGNFVEKTVIDTIAGIAPVAPDIIEVFRNTGTAAPGSCDPDEGACEYAYFDGDEDAYYTRFSGDDLIVRFAGARGGYQVQVLDGTGDVLRTVDVSSSPADVRVPIGIDEVRYERALRLINANGIVGEATPFDVVLDQTAPAIDNVSFTVHATAGDQAVATFTEKIVEGTNFASDWNIVERLGNGGRYVYPPDRVEGSDDTRTLTFTEEGFGDLETAEYYRESAWPGSRYRDRGGNELPNNLGAAG